MKNNKPGRLDFVFSYLKRDSFTLSELESDFIQTFGTHMLNSHTSLRTYIDEITEQGYYGYNRMTDNVYKKSNEPSHIPFLFSW